MARELENKVRDNVSKFDHIEIIDSDLMWSDFERKKAQNQHSISYKIKTHWIIVIVIGSIIVAASFIYHCHQTSTNTMIINELKKNEMLFAYQQELDNSMILYASTIKKMNIHIEDYPKISESLDQVETLSRSYHEDLKKYGVDPKIIKALLKCDKQKVRLYEMLLYQVEMNNYYEKKNIPFII